MAKHRLIPPPHQSLLMRVAQVCGAIVAFLLVGLVATALAEAQNATVITRVDPRPHTVDIASTPVLYLVVPSA